MGGASEIFGLRRMWNNFLAKIVKYRPSVDVKWNKSLTRRSAFHTRSVFHARSAFHKSHEGFISLKKDQVTSDLVFFWLGCRDFALDFCSTFRICFNVMFRKNLRSPFKNSALCCFFHCVRIPFIYPQQKNKGYQMVSFVFWLGCRDSNPGNVRVRVWCLTAWRHPNIFDFDIISQVFLFVNRFMNIFITFFVLKVENLFFALFDKINTLILHFWCF